MINKLNDMIDNLTEIDMIPAPGGITKKELKILLLDKMLKYIQVIKKDIRKITQ